MNRITIYFFYKILFILEKQQNHRYNCDFLVIIKNNYDIILIFETGFIFLQDVLLFFYAFGLTVFYLLR